MTWYSHTVANGAIAFALTGEPVIAVTAMFTAALPDQLEFGLPFFKHRGFTHWIILWSVILIASMFLPAHPLAGFLSLATSWLTPFLALKTQLSFQHFYFHFAREITVGLALGPLLHALLDGCSAAGVPIGPFIDTKLKLKLYRTKQTRQLFSFDFTEMIFLTLVLIACAVVWKSLWWVHA